MSSDFSKKFATTPENIYYTQKVLADFFTVPAFQLMREGVVSYVNTGKIPNLKTKFELLLSPLWDRTMYSGIADAEADVNSSGNKSVEFGSSLTLSDSLSLIEFASRKQSEEEKTIRADIRNKKKLQDSIIRQMQQGSVTREQAERNIAELNQEIAAKQDYIDQFFNTSKKAKSRKKTSSSKPAIRSVAGKDIADTAPSRSTKGKEVDVTKDVEIPKRDSPQERKINIQSRINRARTNIAEGLLSKSADPSNINIDPYAQFGVDEKKKAAVDRLRETNNLQIYGTLNDRYPALSKDSFFNKYLEERQKTVASSLQKQYQERIIKTVADYGGSGSAEETLKNIKNIYRDSPYGDISRFVNQLSEKRNNLKVPAADYIEYLEELEKGQEVAPTTVSSKNAQRLAVLQKRDNDLSRRYDELLEEDPEGNNKSVQKKLDQIERMQAKLEPQLIAAERGLTKDEAKESWLTKRRLAANKFKDNPNKLYDDPRKTRSLSKAEKSKIIKYLGLTEKNSAKEIKQLKASDEFTGKQLAYWIDRLKSKNLIIEDELVEIASRTANTEVSAAYNIGRLQTYIDRGVKFVQWISTIDARTSVFCQSLHLKVFELKDITTQALAQQTFPKTRKPEYHPDNRSILKKTGFSLWLPPVHPYCRSYLVPVYTDKQKDLYDPTDPTLPPDANLEDFLLDSLLDKRKAGRMSEKELKSLVQRQQNIRDKKADKLSDKIKTFTDLFNGGLDFLTGSLKENKVANFTPEEIKKNDKKLTSVLLGGTAVMGFGAMMYFFVKSNLGSAVKQWLATKTTDIFGGKAAKVTEQTAVNLLSSLALTDDLPIEVKELIGRNELVPENVGNLFRSATQNNEKGKVYLDLLSKGVSPEDIDSSFIPNNLIGTAEGIALARVNHQNALNSLQGDLRQQMNAFDNIIRRAYSNSSEAIDPDNISAIEYYSGTNSYRIAKKKGRGTFVKKSQYDSVVNNPDNRVVIDSTLQKAEEVERALDAMESVVDNEDLISKANILRTRYQLTGLRALADADNADNILSVPDSQRRLEAFEQFKVDQISQLANAQADYSDIVSQLNQKLDSYTPAQLAIVPEGLNSVAELKDAKKLIQANLAELRKNFSNKNVPYTVKTAAKKLDIADSDSVRQLAVDAENAARILNDSGISTESTINNLETSFRNRVSENINQLNDLLSRIDNRINEL